MKMHTLLSFGFVAMLALVAMPASNASGPIFCPAYNPNALTNACVDVDFGTANVMTPVVGNPVYGSICIIGGYCVPTIMPGIGWTTTAVPMVDGSGTYVEVTPLCHPYAEMSTSKEIKPRCRVSWEDLSVTAELLA